MSDGDTSQDEGRRHFPSSTTVALCLLPLLYYLSIGPFIWLADQDVIAHGVAETIVNTFYFPVVFVAESWEPFGDLTERYVSLWVQ